MISRNPVRHFEPSSEKLEAMISRAEAKFDSARKAQADARRADREARHLAQSRTIDYWMNGGTGREAR